MFYLLSDYTCEFLFVKKLDVGFLPDLLTIS
jgi:hypothetical protein